MFITDDVFDKTRIRIDAEPWRTFYRDMVSLADELLVTDYPPADPEFTDWTLFLARFFSRATLTLAGMYKLTGEEKYAERAYCFIKDCLGWPEWYVEEQAGVQHFDLATGELAFAFSVLLGWLGKWLGEERLGAIKETLAEKLLIPYLRAFDTSFFSEKPWWYGVTSNWNMICNGGMLCLALRLQPEREDAATAFKIALAGIDSYIGSLHADGSGEEGIGYWTYAAMFLTYAFLSYEAATGMKHAVFQHPALGAGLSFPFDFSFGYDSPGISFCDINWFRPTGILYALAARTGQKQISALLTKRFMERCASGGLPVFEAETAMWPDEIFALLCCDEPYDGCSEENGKPLFRAYPDNGWGLFKHGGLALSFRSGSTATGHAMRDLNSVQLAADGVLLLENMGNHPYPEGWFGPARELFPEDQTISKNSQLFNGIGQRVCGDAVFSHDLTSMRSDAAQTYPAFVRKAQRTVGITDNGLTIADDMVSEFKTWHEIRFLTGGDFVRRSERTWVVEKDGATVSLSFASDSTLHIAVCDAPRSIGTRPAFRMLRVMTVNPVLSSCITTHIAEEFCHMKGYADGL